MRPLDPSRKRLDLSSTSVVRINDACVATDMLLEPCVAGAQGLHYSPVENIGMRSADCSLECEAFAGPVAE